MRAASQVSGAILLAIAAVLALPVPANAAPPSPAPSPSPAAALAVTAPTSGTFVPVRSVPISGTKAAGSSIRVPGVEGCTIAAGPAETWSCTASGLPDGPDFAIAPVQTLGGVETTLDPPVTIDVLGPPTIDGGTEILTTGVLSGLAHPGSRILLGVGATERVCPAPAREDGYWSCVLEAPSGVYQVQAAQQNSAIGSPPHNVSQPTTLHTVVIDRDAPASAVVSTPRDQQRVARMPATFAGSGETGGHVDVYLDNTILCSAPVVDGRWSCVAGGIADGRHTVRAVLRDAAGNYADPSEPIRVDFGPAPTSPDPPRDPGAGPGPGSAPGPGPGETPDPAPSPDPDPSPTSPPPPPTGPSSPGTTPPAPGAPTHWGTPTGFGSHLPSPAAILANGNGLLGLAAASGFIVLLALPLRLLAGVVRGRVRRRLHGIRFTGRNRDHTVTPEEDSIPVNPWLAALVPLGAAALLVVFSGGFTGEVRYLRLGFAAGVGIGILNLVAVAITGRATAAWQRVSGRLKVLPALLIAAAAAAVLSRVTGVEPPFLIGVFVAILFAADAPVRPRAVTGLAQLLALAVLSVAAWLGLWAIGPVAGFWASIPSEILATVCIAGFGSILALLLPLGALPGRALLEWSPLAWTATALVLGTLSFAVLAGDPLPVAGFAIAGAVAAGFAALAVASWAWGRFVDPVPRPAQQRQEPAAYPERTERAETE